MAWFHAFGLEKRLKENTAIAVELKAGQTKDRKLTFKKWLETQTEIINGTIQQIDSITMKQLLAPESIEDSLQKEMMSVVPEIFIFKMKREYLSADQLQKFRNKIMAQPVVKELSFQNELTQDLDAMVKRIRNGFMALTLVFIIVGILISQYLAQVFVDSRESIIQSWNELGASGDKILMPYLKRVIYLGLASACIGICMIGLIILLTNYLMPWVYQWIDPKKFLLVSLILMIFGPTLQYFLVKNKIQSLLN